jgi:hypothetical protein
LISIAVAWPSFKVREAANAVKVGQPVPPIALPLLSQALVPIRADPVTVEPSGKPKESPATDRLQQAKLLLYLGQAGGTVVFYDPAMQRAVYVPGSAVILHVANCRAEPPPDACQQASR